MTNPIIIHIKCPRPTNRLSFVLHEIFGRYHDVSWTAYDGDNDRAHVTINYSNSGRIRHDELVIFRAGLLYATGCKHLPIRVGFDHDLPVFFMAEEWVDVDYRHDVFAMIFYLLSRYEEYGDTTKDSHGRFPSHASLAHQHDFLKMPLVDLWIQRLYSDIQDRLSNRRMTPKGRPHSYPSIDIDMPLAFKYKGPRSYLGLFRDIVSGRMDTAQGRMKTWFGGTDPFDTYSQILEFAAERTITWRFFVLLNYQRPFDLNHLAHRPEMKRIVDQLSPKHHVGLHPSYLSHQSTDQLRKEHKGLCDLLQTQIVMSRQHFIKISLPETYRSLVELGIQEDHSMMYPDQCGFRAGTCHPFRWYDLLADHVTDLVIHPYQCMEVTMRYYEKMDVEQAIAEVTQLHQSCQEVGGTFGWIWHNSSLSRAYGWEPWRKVFDHLLVLSAA